MTRNKVLLLLQSVLCIILVVMLAAAAISIYKTGIAEKQENPLAWVYTREKVAAALKPVIPVFLLAVGVTVAGSVLGVRDEQQDKPVKDAELTRDLMVSRVAEPDDAMKKERALQKKLLVGGWAAFAVCMLPVVLYMVNGSHFQNGDLEVMFQSFAGHVLPWVAAGIACLMISALLQGKSMQCEADAASARIKEEKEQGIKLSPKPAALPKDQKIVRLVILAVAVVFIIVGIRNGSLTAVINKAIRICTECVGLG